MASPRQRAPKSFSPSERATILDAAKRLGAPVAAKQFGCSTKAIERWKRAIADGSDPELASSVAARAADELNHAGDLFDDVWSETLGELRKRLPDMTNAQVLKAVAQLGDLSVKRDLLGGDDDDEERGGTARRSTAATEVQGRGAADSRGPAATPSAVH